MSVKRGIPMFSRALFIVLFLVTSHSFADLPSDYENWQAKEKQSWLWQEGILPSEYDKLPPYIKGGFKALLGFVGSLNLRKSFTHTSDEMPVGRAKIIHTYGAVAQVDFIPAEDSPYTGIFQGASGLARLGWAAPPAFTGHIPGMAVKFFIDGHPSANIHVMEKLDGQGSNTNFFAGVFTNIIPPPESPILQLGNKFFATAVTRTTHLSVDHLSLRDRDGALENSPLAPFQIFLLPSEEAQLPSASKADLRIDLETLPIGTLLYEVYATMNEEDRDPQYIGSIVQTSRFVSSKYGDEKLFFKHSDRFLRK
jgi:hypothetical protein